MTEITAKLHAITIANPLPGLTEIDTYHIRPLEPMTRFSIANGFLKLAFPPQNHYELAIRLLQKGLSFPQFAKHQLDTLPLKTVEQLAKMVLEITVTNLDGEAEEKSIMDRILTLLIAMEEARQYDLQALVSEDLGLLEMHQQGGLHGFYYRSRQNSQHLANVLQAEGYRDDFLLEKPAFMPLAEAYWLCRQLTVVFPWSCILDQYLQEKPEGFPYLNRLALIKAFLLEKHSAFLQQASTASQLLKQVYPILSEAIRQDFPRFSQQAHIPRPVQAMVLVEGSTEELLIPAIAKSLGKDLDYEGIHIQSVGGKNQMLQQYVDTAEHLAVPICIVLDKDAQPLWPDLNYYKRPQDRILILEEGEFEDIYAWELVAKTINEYYQPIQQVNVSQLKRREESSRVKTLHNLWQELGLGLFDKVAFAQNLVQTLTHEQFVSLPMRRLITEIIGAKADAIPDMGG